MRGQEGRELRSGRREGRRRDEGKDVGEESGAAKNNTYKKNPK